MNRKKNPRLAAVIDIDSNALKMRISQLKKGKIENIDLLEYPLRLGHEVFTDGKISFESLRELSSLLHGYEDVLTGYGVTDCRTVATTALREAENRSFIIDQLKIQNGIQVEVLEDDQEKTLIYWEILNYMNSRMEKTKGESALICHIGAGTIGFSVYDGKQMIFSQNIPMGSLKLHDMLGNIQNATDDFSTVVEEYLDSILWHIHVPLESGKAGNLVLTGSGVRLIAKICGIELKDGRYELDSFRIKELFEQIRKMPQDRIGRKYNLSEETAELLYSSLAIAIRLLRFTASTTILSPEVELWDALIRQMLIPKSSAQYLDHVRVSAISCAGKIADSYHCSRTHTECVREFSCKIFDKMKGAHGLGRRERLLLELAAILHDCGHYVTAKRHLQSSYDLIKDTDIYGLTDEEMLLTAFVARYNEYDIPNHSNAAFASLNEKNRLIVSKLVAIFRLANSLDKSQKQKLTDLKVRLEKDLLTISSQSDANLYLEQWAFDQCAPYFKEVFGYNPELTIKSNLL
ncbi:HD domain-containing protein [Caproiciproducens sp. NJN-50]|uniref:Ppx/GppA phosphatase family protein n=1 Tax=Acutalibacteraceae TaxID=3082771 RepID=UPI000FFE0A37|nr:MULTISPECIES: HD domain-containing protein [Acutalibacteraceae]QAT49643.1 HD domain-containing protein [Caproiciproducens sp. NJN-50]